MKKIIALMFGIALMAICGGLGVYTLNHTTDPVASDRITLGSGPDPVPTASRSMARGGQIDEGIWEIGGARGPAAGSYRVAAPLDTSSMCYWQISKDGAGDDIVKNGIETGGTPQVKLAKGQWFKTTGCGSWVRL